MHDDRHEEVVKLPLERLDDSQDHSARDRSDRYVLQISPDNERSWNQTGESFLRRNLADLQHHSGRMETAFHSR